MIQWQEGDAISNGIRLHSYRGGAADGPVILLSHGVTDSGACWPDLAPVLADRFHVVSYDARNHGRSEYTHEVYGWDTLGDDEAGLITALDLAPVVLIGHSMGAGTAAACAARHPDLVRGCILEDPPWMNRGLATPAQGPSRRETYEKMQSQSIDALIAGARQNTPGWDPSILRPWAEAKKRFNLDIADLYRPDLATWRETAEAIRCPVLLITANPELGARMTAVEREQAAQALQLGTAVNIPGAGHNIRREQFARYLGYVEAFLEQFS
jgi:pimeloyl-ACP methyl ester carboxylesterase